MVREQKLLELYAENLARADELLEEVRRALELYLESLENEKTLKEIITEIENYQISAQARDTWN